MLLNEISVPLALPVIFEGGNEFKNTAGEPTTIQNATTAQAQSVATALGKELNIPLHKYMSGSVIYQHASTGDVDTVLDPVDFIDVEQGDNAKAVQNKMRAWLGNKLQAAGYQELPKKQTVDAPGKYYKIAGDGLTVSVQVPGGSDWLQVDLDIAEPGEGKFSRWSRRGEPNAEGTPKDERAKGAFRHILKSGIARAINPNWKWSYKNGLVDEESGKSTKDPDAVAKAFFGDNGKASDLDNISTILKAFKASHPELYQGVVDKVNTGIANMKYNYRIS
jgi:hypothetical protein